MNRNEYQKEKGKQLGVAYSTARSMLYKIIIFDLVRAANLNSCYRCGKVIDCIEDFSVDHKVEWMHQSNAKELYFDLLNIAFSHLRCNSTDHRCRRIFNNKYGFKGVTQSNRHKTKQWRAYIHKDNKTMTLGYFSTKEEAAAVYDKAATELFGLKAVTNKQLGLL